MVADPPGRVLEAARVLEPAAGGGHGGGAFLIALKENYELVEGHEWPTALFWVLVVVMAGIAAVNTAARMSRTHQIVERAQSE